MNYSIIETQSVVVEASPEGSYQEAVLYDGSSENFTAASPEVVREVEIACDQLPAQLCEVLSSSLEGLRDLKAEITQKIEFAWYRESVLESRIEQLMREAGSVDENRKKVLGESVSMYTSLLRGVITEIDEELVFFGPFTTSEHPRVVSVPFGASHGTSTTFFEHSVKLLKSQSKNIRKYLAVSYSRYMYGFDLQERNLERLEYKVTALNQSQQ